MFGLRIYSSVSSDPVVTKSIVLNGGFASSTIWRPRIRDWAAFGLPRRCGRASHQNGLPNPRGSGFGHGDQQRHASVRCSRAIKPVESPRVSTHECTANRRLLFRIELSRPVKIEFGDRSGEAGPVRGYFPAWGENAVPDREALSMPAALPVRLYRSSVSRLRRRTVRIAILRNRKVFVYVLEKPTDPPPARRFPAPLSPSRRDAYILRLGHPVPSQQTRCYSLERRAGKRGGREPDHKPVERG